MTGKVLKCLVPKGVVYVYGALSMEYIRQLDMNDMVLNSKSITGLYLTDWIGKKNILS